MQDILTHDCSRHDAFLFFEYVKLVLLTGGKCEGHNMAGVSDITSNQGQGIKTAVNHLSEQETLKLVHSLLPLMNLK